MRNLLDQAKVQSRSPSKSTTIKSLLRAHGLKFRLVFGDVTSHTLNPQVALLQKCLAFDIQSSSSVVAFCNQEQVFIIASYVHESKNGRLQ
jgi:hypothetical protein